MAGLKDKLKNIIDQLPEDVTFDDVIAELYFRMKVDSGLNDLANDRVMPHSEVKERMAKWLAKK